MDGLDIDATTSEWLLYVCDPGRAVSPAVSAPAFDWERLGALADLHGLQSLAFERLRSALPPERQDEIPSDWAIHHLVQGARNVCALEQLDELAVSLRAHGIPAIALKGAAVLGTHAGSPSWRRLDDLDILVPETRTSDVDCALRELGYRSTQRERSHTSLVEHRLVERRREHLAPYVREDRLPVEIHVNLMRRAHREAVLTDAWSEARPFEGSGCGLRRLREEHFVIHTAVHYIKHLESGFAPLKSLVDLLHLLRSQSLEWELLQRTAVRWGVWREVATILATLRDWWSIPIPRDLGGCGAIPISVLAAGSNHLENTPERQRLTYRTRRFKRLGEIPGIAARVAYVSGLLWPAASYLRERYQVQSDTSLLPYYLRHLGGGLIGLLLDTVACAIPVSRRARVR